MQLPEKINKTMLIHAPVSKVWDTLTKPELIKTWMLETELEIISDWKIGSTFIISGDLHGIPFENKGSILQFEKENVFEYNYLSSISSLPDTPENYTSVEFKLSPQENNTLLSITISNFPDEIIFKHCEFYWGGTILIIKKMVENGRSLQNP